MEYKIVTPKINNYIVSHQLKKKWDKALNLFYINPKHPSLNTELMEPKEEMIFSFRIDKKYRALFVIKNNTAFIFKVTNHYK